MTVRVVSGLVLTVSMLLTSSFPESCCSVDGSFFPTQSHSHSEPNKHTEAYIDFKLLGLLFRLITNYLLQLKLTHNSYLYLAMWLGTFSK